MPSKLQRNLHLQLECCSSHCCCHSTCELLWTWGKPGWLLRTLWTACSGLRMRTTIFVHLRPGFVVKIKWDTGWCDEALLKCQEWYRAWAECSVLYSEFPLAIYFTYGNVQVSMLLSQIIPPSPSSTGSKSLFFIFVFPLALPLLTLYKTPFCLKSLGKNAFLCLGELYSPPIRGLLSLNKGHPTLY